MDGGWEGGIERDKIERYWVRKGGRDREREREREGEREFNRNLFCNGQVT
jgi:hypothetical protein